MTPEFIFYLLAVPFLGWGWIILFIDRKNRDIRIDHGILFATLLVLTMSTIGVLIEKSGVSFAARVDGVVDSLHLILVGVLWFFCYTFLANHHKRALAQSILEAEIARSALAARHQHLEILIQNMPDAICMRDRSGQIILKNPAYTRIAGSLPSRENPQQWFPFVKDTMGPDWAETDQETIRSGEPIMDRVEEIRDAQNHVRWLHRSHVPLAGENGEIMEVLTILRDVTAHRSIEEERMRLHRQVEQGHRLESLGRLAGGVAHDFNNLLTGILGNATLLSDTHPKDCSNYGAIVDIETAAQRAADLCRQLLSFAGKGSVSVVPINLNELLQESQSLLEISIGKSALLELVLNPELPPIKADTNQLRQIVLNLVVNGAESLPQQSGTITLTTAFKNWSADELGDYMPCGSLAAGPYVLLEVKDTGNGMDTATLSRIFDPFFTTKAHSRGLGLAAVLGFVRAHGGGLQVQSAPGKGSQFRIMLPAIARPEPKPIPPPAPAPEQGCVLIADDESSVRMVLGRIMVPLGFQPVEVADGIAALNALGTEPSRFTLAMVDLSMPSMNGTDTIAGIRKIAPTLPVVLMSGYRLDEAEEGLAGDPYTHFIQKPFSTASLRNALQKAMARE